MPHARLTLVLSAFVLAPLSASAQGLPIGNVVWPEDCAHVDGGELYAQNLDGAHDDWQVHALDKGGPLVGFLGGDYSDGMYQLNAWNFARLVPGNGPYVVFATFPHGGLYLDSERLQGFNWMGSSRVQQVGDTPPASLSSAEPSVETVLPDELGAWQAGLESGPASFPRLSDGWPEIAFAPVREIDLLVGEPCSTGGLAEDSEAGGGLLAGYNVYRVEAEERPSLVELARPENWLDYFSYPPEADDQARLHDPDDLLSSGDEVLVYVDGDRAQDSSPRAHGTPPVMETGRRYWYAVQPVARGAVRDFGSVALGGYGEPIDHRADLDGDGRHDAVDFGGAGSADGPEFVSPQAEAGEWGLGLTTQGRALLSKRMAVDVSSLTDAIPHSTTERAVTEPLQLRLVGDLVVWGGGPAGVSRWRLRRSSTPEAQAPGGPSAGSTLWWPTARVRLDPERPSSERGVFYYRVEPLH